MATNQNGYETSDDMMMPLPLTEEEAGSFREEDLTRERKIRLSRPAETTPALTPGIQLPPNITVIPIIPGITRIGYIRFFNARPSAGPVDIYVNGRRVAKNLPYRDFTEYMKVFPGRYRVAVFETGTRWNPVTVSTITVAPNRTYTAALIGLPGSSSIQMITDTRRRIDRSKALVRFVQLSPNAPRMDVYWNDSLVLEDLEYQEVSRYLETAPGEYNLKLRDYLTGAVLLEDPSIRLKGGNIYTVYVVGTMQDRTGLQVIIPLEGISYLQF